jgi:hypothetical protein
LIASQDSSALLWMCPMQGKLQMEADGKRGEPVVRYGR